ncbi:MAG: hypothetical protein ACREEQ_13070 [Caulobacteraceae bacterium]
MNRRQVFAAALTAALAVDAGEAAVQPAVAATPSALEKTPLFPDDGQFWFADSDDAEHSFRHDPERCSGMMPNT